MPKILIVEDEAKIAQTIADYLQQAEYETHWHPDGQDAAAIALSLPADLVILDIMLPGKDGLQVCREIRAARDIPIIMLTARIDEIDRLLGLELGADDYICKPFSPRELVVRIRNILKRVAQTATDTGSSYGGLHIDVDRHQCHLEDRLLDLTPVEFRLLTTLCARPGQVFAREQLMQAAYTDGRYVSGRTIDTHIKNLRSKLGASGTMIHSIYGVGYKLE